MTTFLVGAAVFRLSGNQLVKCRERSGEIFAVATSDRQHVARLGLVEGARLLLDEFVQQGLCIRKPGGLDKALRLIQLLRVAVIRGASQKSYDRRRPTVRGRLVTTLGVKFWVSTYTSPLSSVRLSMNNSADQLSFVTPKAVLAIV